MSSHPSRQRRSRLRAGSRAVPQTVSQLTGGLPSSSFFTSPRPSSPTPNTPPANPQPSDNDNTQPPPPPPPSPPSNPRPPTPAAATPTPTPPPAPSPSTPSPTNLSATHPPSSTPSTLSRVNASTDPNLHSPPANNSMVLAGKSSQINSSQQLSATPAPTNIKSGPNLSAPSLIHNTLPPNFIEAIVVVTAGIALILGGIFFYCFKIKRRQKRINSVNGPSSTSHAKDHPTTLHPHSLSRSGSIVSSSHHNRGLNWPIDKKSIKVKKKTESIISFGPGPEPEAPRYPSSVMTLTDEPRINHLHLMSKENSGFSDHSFHSADIPYGHPKKKITEEYNPADEISHIPISYEAKPAAKGRTPTARGAPLWEPRTNTHQDLGQEAPKKVGPKRYNRVSRAARKLVPARLITGVGIDKTGLVAHNHTPLPPPHPSRSQLNNSNLKAAKLTRNDNDYPTNYSYYQS